MAGQYMLIYEYAPTFYITTGTRNPTSYDLLPSSALSPQVEAAVLADLKLHNTKLVLTDAPIQTRIPTAITRYIEHNYRNDISLFEFDLWVRK